MKRLKSIFAFVLVVIFSGTFLVACSKNKKSESDIAKEKFDIAYAALLEAKNYAQDIERKDFRDGEFTNTSNWKIITNRANNETKRYHELDNSQKIYSVISNTDTNLIMRCYDIDERKYTEQNERKDQLIMNEGSGAVENRISYFEYGMLNTFDLDYNNLFEYLYTNYKADFSASTIEYTYMEESGFKFSTCAIRSVDMKLTFTVSLNAENKVSSVKYVREDDSLDGYMQVISTFRYTGEDLNINVNVDGFTLETESSSN